MKFLKFLAVFCGVVLLSCFLTVQIHPYTAQPFERVLSRILMVLGIVSVLVFTKVRPKQFLEFGLGWRNDSRRHLFQGFLLGFVMLFLLTATAVFLEGRTFSPRDNLFPKFFLKLPEYLISALVVGFIEESFFRGFMFNKFKKKTNVILSFAAMNFIYAMVHFFKGGSYPVPLDPGFWDGLKFTLHLGDDLFRPALIWPNFLGLFFFGSVLALAYQRTSLLYLSIGIHAGCVFFLKVDNWFIESVPNTSALLFGDKNLHSGILGWIFLSILSAVIVLFYKRDVSYCK